MKSDHERVIPEYVLAAPTSFCAHASASVADSVTFINNHIACGECSNVSFQIDTLSPDSFKACHLHLWQLSRPTVHYNASLHPDSRGRAITQGILQPLQNLSVFCNGNHAWTSCSQALPLFCQLSQAQQMSWPGIWHELEPVAQHPYTSVSHASGSHSEGALNKGLLGIRDLTSG